MNTFISTNKPTKFKSPHTFKHISLPLHDCAFPASKEEVKHHWKGCRVKSDTVDVIFYEETVCFRH